jgi:phosphoglycolate phosphatase-like HAD superfamily hydrolase
MAPGSGPAGKARDETLVRLALFDIDGTLIRTRGVGIQAFFRAMASEFGVVDGHAAIRFGGRTDTSLVRELFGCCGVEHCPEHVRRFFDSYVFWLDHLLSENKSGSVCPGVLRLIDALLALAEPPRIGLLTGNIRLGAEIKLRHFGLWHLFELGGFGDDHEDRNQIAVIARDRGGQAIGRTLSGSEILVVGDTAHDIACGRAIEARVLAVTTGGATAEELGVCAPDWLVSSLEEVDAAQICGFPGCLARLQEGV